MDSHSWNKCTPWLSRWNRFSDDTYLFDSLNWPNLMVNEQAQNLQLSLGDFSFGFLTRLVWRFRWSSMHLFDFFFRTALVELVLSLKPGFHQRRKYKRKHKSLRQVKTNIEISASTRKEKFWSGLMLALASSSFSQWNKDSCACAFYRVFVFKFTGT